MAIIHQFLVVVLLSVSFDNVSGAWDKTIYVSSAQISDKPGCGSQVLPCKTLDFALKRATESGTNSTRVLVKAGNYNLTSSFKVTRVENFAIFGEGAKKDVVIKCPKSNTSIAFIIAENIILQGFTLVNCGDWHVSTVSSQDWIVNNPKYITAVYINYCRDLQIANVEIKGTPGVGMTAYSVSGKVEVTNVAFRHNVPLTGSNSNSSILNLFDSQKGEYAKAGGGMFMLIGMAKHNPINISTEEAKKYITGNSIYTIKNCTFAYNKAPTPNFEMKDIPSLPFSRGGGLAIFSTGSAANNSISIDSCLFIGNKAVWGGGLQVEFKVKSQNNTVRVTNTIFESNFAIAAGGAARLGSTVEENPYLLPNFFYIIGCQVTNNTATWGGGFTTFAPTYLPLITRQNIYQHGVVLIQACILARNKGTVGAAIGAFLVNLNEDEIGPAVPYKLILDNSTITNNEVVMMQHTILLGQGTIYADEVPTTLRNGVSITNNTGTAIVLDAATLEISDYAEFVHNSGYRGGALALYGASKVELRKNSNLVFRENKCAEKGGAMFVSSQGPPLVSFNATGVKTHKCFFTYEEQGIDYDDWKTNITFRGNGFSSMDSNPLGKSIFASSLRDCRRVGELRANNTALEWKIISYLDARGQRVAVKGHVVTDPIDIVYDSSEWSVSPSQLFNATVKLIDEKENEVFGIIHVDIQGVNTDSNVHLGTPSSLFLVHEKVQNLILSGTVGSRFSVVLRTIGGQLVYRTITGLTLNRCFPGFQQAGSACVCSSKDNSGIQNCSKNGKEVYIKKGYWAGTVNHKYKTYTCPINYCEGGSSLYSSEEPAYLYNKSSMCAGHRDSESVLCGHCKPGYSVMIGADSCSSECNNLYLLTIIPYAVILFLAVMLIMAINLDVFTGYLNAWLYSYQVMSLLFNEGFTMDPFMQFIVGLANIQIKTGGNCLVKGIDDADKLAILYILPTYILISVFILAKIVRRYPGWCYSKHVKAPFRAFCTLFVLCYTNITSISLKILYPASIGGETVLYREGGVKFFKGKHIGYSILAIVYIFIVVIPFPLTLMFTPFFTKCLRPVFNLNNLKPIYDAYQACFKDDYRWCSAFYFVCRFYLLLISTYVPPGATKHAVLECSCMVILIVFVYLKPYKEENKWLNRLDAVLLTNLSFITILSSALQQVNHSQAQVYDGVIKALTYVPLGYLVYLVIYVTYERREQLRAFWARKMARRMSLEQYSETDHTSGMDPENQQLAECAA